jgi:hypothetical protein
MPLLILLSVLLFSPTDIDWTGLQSEAVQLLQELIRIDTTNPPGETPEGFIANLRGVLKDPELNIEVLD